MTNDETITIITPQQFTVGGKFPRSIFSKEGEKIYSSSKRLRDGGGEEKRSVDSERRCEQSSECLGLSLLGFQLIQLHFQLANICDLQHCAP